MHIKPMQLDLKLHHNIPVGGLPADVFGVEVELEGRKIAPYTDACGLYWVIHEDGSLRKLAPGDQAIEYVLKHPYNIEKTIVAIQNLFKFLKSPGVEVYESYRTSIHVHLNFGQETHRTIYNFITLSTIFDELFVSQNGDHRIGNNFCLRGRDASGQIYSLIKSIQSNHEFFNLQAQERYSSINYASLMKFGSIEFRSLECTTHEGRLIHWIRTLQQLKEVSRDFVNPVEIIQQFSLINPSEFLMKMLGPYAVKYRGVKDFEEMLFRGMRLAQDIAYCSAWKEAEKQAPAPKPKAKVQGWD